MKKSTDMRGFRSKEFGRFRCSITENVMGLSGTEHLLKFKGATKSDVLVIPDYLLPEAKQIMRRGGGDKMLDFAGLCIRHEVALTA